MINNKTKIFIEKAKKKHEGTYNYSKTIYVNSRTKVIIICKIHGEFKQRPLCHTNVGHGCPECKIQNRRMSLDEFIKRANKIHNNKYNYTKVIYKNKDTKVIIICPEHGEFKQRPNAHLQGHECSRCGKEKMVKSKKNKIIINEKSKRPRVYDNKTFIYYANKVHVL